MSGPLGLSLALNSAAIRPSGSTPAPSAPTPNAPTLTKTNSAGSALALSIAVDSTVAVGMYWRMQVAADAAFTTPLPSEGAIRETFRSITMADFTATPDPFACLANQPSGTLYCRLRVEIDDGTGFIASTWSNTVSEAVVTLTPATLDTVAKSTYLSLQSSNMQVRNNATGVGSISWARSTQSRSGKYYFETVKTETSGNSADFHGIGLCNSSQAFTPTTTGTFTTSSADRCFVRDDGAFRRTGDTNITPVSTSWTVTTDVWHISFDTTAGKWWAGKNGTWWNGDPVAGTGGYTLPPGALFAMLGVTPQSARFTTLEFRPAATTHLPSGYTVFT